MSFTHWLSNHLCLSRRPASRRKTPAVRPTFRLTLEALEDRWVPSTLTVLNNLDSGAGSLRAEIGAAKNGDTIVFAPSLNGQTITLTSGELLIKHGITIAGPGAGNLTVSGNHASRVFEVARGTQQVTLSGLTISNGLAPSGSNGGGIYNDGTQTVSACTLSGNTTSQGAGGGIFNYNTLTVSGSTLSGNTATTAGGGIFNAYKLTVSSSTLSGNTATSGIHGGGGIYNAAGTASISGSFLSGNSASQGGGIYNDVGTLTLSSSTLSGNSASQGGGIFNTGTATVKNSSSITGNTAPVGFGADVYNQGVLYLDSTSTISILDGNPAVPI
jgi:hypothetical protein